MNPDWDDIPSIASHPVELPPTPIPSFPGAIPAQPPPEPRSRLAAPRHDRDRFEPKTPAEFSGEIAAHHPTRLSKPPADRGADEFRTIGIGSGLDVGSPETSFVLQYAVGKRPWRDLETIEPEWHPAGRESFRMAGPAAAFLSEDHFRIITEGDRVYVEPGKTINGVYLKLQKRRPFELTSGARFQVAQHVIEFRVTEPVGPGDSGMIVGGETFRTARLEPMAYLDFLSPDGNPNARFPMTKPEGTVIGRKGDIVLPEESGVSRSHASICKRQGRWFLEDLESTNGTFVKIDSRAQIRPGGPLDALSGDVLLVGAMFVRVVES